MEKEQFEKISKWQDETFGKATALSKMAHLEDELQELKRELEFFTEHEDSMQYPAANKLIKNREFADNFILLFGIAASDGMTYEDICECIDEKMKINYERKWGKPQENGVVNHIS